MRRKTMWKNKRWKKTPPFLQEHQLDACCSMNLCWKEFTWHLPTFKKALMSSQEECKWWRQLLKTKRMAHCSSNIELEEGGEAAVQWKMENFSKKYFKKVFQEFRTSPRKSKKVTKCSRNAPRIPRFRFFKQWWSRRRREERFEADNYKMEIDLPVFSGTRDIEAFLDWIKNVESFFGYMNTPNDEKVKLVALKLKGGALTWWDQLE